MENIKNIENVENVENNENVVETVNSKPISMSVFEGYKGFLKTIFGMFKGRARRKEYWGTILFNILLILPVILIFVLTMFVSGLFSILFVVYTYFLTAYMLLTFLPGLALGVKRLHDIGKSGWWLLICLIPFIGPVIVLVWNCKDSEKSTNKYGKSTKYVDWS